ncbi:MAG: hypothetical protein CK424_03495 [Legionella sp.]|nr:MAG: hypothetical protein CK424_03495 [Legionella sp.]
MIIALSTDTDTIRATRDLKTLYSNETARRIDQIIALNHDLSQLREHPIKRITFIGHAHHNKYGKVTANIFAEHLISILKVNEARSPDFWKNLEAIDLLGCEVGLVTQDRASFAAEVTKHLEREGYHIPINSFTNQSQNHPEMSKSILIYMENKWLFFGFSSEKNLKKFKDLTRKHNNIVDNMNEKGEEICEHMAIIESLQTKNETLQHKIDWFYNDTQKIMKAEEFVEMMKAEITQNSIKILEAQTAISNINDVIHQFNETRLQVIEQKNTFAHLIATTQDPRDYFDAHPECNFMKKPDTIGISKAYKITHSQQVKREKVIESEHPLHIPGTRH